VIEKGKKTPVSRAWCSIFFEESVGTGLRGKTKEHLIEKTQKKQIATKIWMMEQKRRYLKSPLAVNEIIKKSRGKKLGGLFFD